MTDAATVRKAIHDFVDENPQTTYERVVSGVQDELGVDATTVTEEIDKMERAEFLYLSENGDATEVTVA